MLYIKSKRLSVFATKIPHPGRHYMHKEFQFMLVIMSVQMDYRDENVKTSGDIKKIHGRVHFWYIFSKQLVVTTCGRTAVKCFIDFSNYCKAYATHI